MKPFRFAAAVPLLLVSMALAGDLEDGRSLQAAGKFAEALPKFEAAVAADPTNPAAALGLSQVLAGLGRYDEAAKAVDAARKANPPVNVLAGLLAAKGRAYLLSVIKAEQDEEADPNLVDSNKSDAQKWAREALKADPKNVEALLLAGQLAQRDKDEGRAIKYFEEAVAADPKSFDAAFEMANYWYMKAGADNQKKDLWEKAEKAFGVAADLDPKSARAAANFAHCKAWQAKGGKEVAAAYMKALELSPTDEKLLSNVYRWTPAEDRAEVFMTLAEASPKDVTRKIYFASALAAPPWKNYDKALDVLGQAANLDPANPWVPLNEGDIKLAQGKKLDEAIDNYIEALTLFKTKGGIDDAAYQRLAGTIAFRSTTLSVEQREKLWTALWKMFPERTDAPNNAGLYYRDVAKDDKQALEWYLRAAKAAPDDVCIQNDTGVIYDYQMHEYEKAEPYYRKAIALGKAKGYDCNKGVDPDRGYRDAINNLYKMLVAKKRWKDLKAFAENDVPENHPLRDMWLKEAEKHK